MKRQSRTLARIVVGTLLCFGFPFPLTAQQDPEAVLQSAIYRAEVQGDLLEADDQQEQAAVGDEDQEDRHRDDGEGPAAVRGQLWRLHGWSAYPCPGDDPKGADSSRTRPGTAAPAGPATCSG